MSHGPGKVERQIAALFRGADPWDGEDRSFTLGELAAKVFGVDKPTRAQRGSVLRGARNVLRRENDADKRWHKGLAEAQKAAVAEFGEHEGYASLQFRQFVDAHPANQTNARRGDPKLTSWRVTERADRTVVFHHRSRPVRVWAVRISEGGVMWVEAEIVKITAARVTIRYQETLAPVDRNSLVHHLGGAWWRGVRFVSCRDGFTAELFDRQWRDTYSTLAPEPMPLEAARRLLELSGNYTREDVISAFRQAAKCCHPDLGGTAEQFQALVQARDRLLAVIGTSAPAPLAPSFAPAGQRVIYRRFVPRQQSLPGTRRALQ